MSKTQSITLSQSTPIMDRCIRNPHCNCPCRSLRIADCCICKSLLATLLGASATSCDARVMVKISIYSCNCWSLSINSHSKVPVINSGWLSPTVASMWKHDCNLKSPFFNPYFSLSYDPFLTLFLFSLKFYLHFYINLLHILQILQIICIQIL